MVRAASHPLYWDLGLQPCVGRQRMISWYKDLTTEMMHSSFAISVYDHSFLAPSALIISSAHYQQQLKGAILQNLSENFCLRRLPMMKLTVTICSLTSLVATLVVVTTSLPQSPSSLPNGIFSRGLPPRPPPLLHRAFDSMDTTERLPWTWRFQRWERP